MLVELTPGMGPFPLHQTGSQETWAQRRGTICPHSLVPRRLAGPEEGGVGLDWAGTLGMRVQGTVAGGELAERGGQFVTLLQVGAGEKPALRRLEMSRQGTWHMGAPRQTLKALVPQPES